MKLILVGHPASQKIVKASKHLVGKYLPMFEPIYLNYEGRIENWTDYLLGFLKYFNDKHIVFSLDDYLISGEIDEAVFSAAISSFGDDNVVSVKLCQSTAKEHEEYPVTTQYTIWDREYLISLLAITTNPWDFEIRGSKFSKSLGGEILHKPCIPYFTNSSLSSRWEGVRTDGLKEEDLKYLKDHALIP